MKKMISFLMLFGIFALIVSCFTAADEREMQEGFTTKIIVSDVKKDVLFKKTKEIFQACFKDLNFTIVSQDSDKGVIYGKIYKRFKSTSYAGDRIVVAVSNIVLRIKDEVVEFGISYSGLDANMSDSVFLTDKDQTVIQNDWRKIFNELKEQLSAVKKAENEKNAEDEEEEYVLIKKEKEIIFIDIDKGQHNIYCVAL